MSLGVREKFWGTLPTRISKSSNRHTPAGVYPDSSRTLGNTWLHYSHRQRPHGSNQSFVHRLVPVAAGDRASRSGEIGGGADASRRPDHFQVSGADPVNFGPQIEIGVD